MKITKVEMRNAVSEIDGVFLGHVYVNGTFVVSEWGTTQQELEQNFKDSRELYELLYMGQYEDECG